MSEPFPLVGPQYHRFLYAVVCDESNGCQLTMASALGRKDVDPWAEAARLTNLPRDAALAALATLLKEFPCDQADTAARLHALLPWRPLPGFPAMAASPAAGIIAVVMILTLLVSLIGISLLVATPAQPVGEDHILPETAFTLPRNDR